jgi:phosphopentomutase
MKLVLLVVDSGGIGAAPDAQAFGDEGANTLGHVMATSGVRLPELRALGLDALLGAGGAPGPHAWAARVHPASAGKDSMAGHWEMMGMVIEEPFPTYPDGLPAELRTRLEKALGTPVLGMEVASGTEIIARLGEEHLRTGYPIVYTSADSVLQIAAHEERVPVERLYAYCQAAREVMQGKDRVGRVIARPFRGSPGAFVRTDRRRDFTVPPGESVLTRLAQAGVCTVGVGKIGDIFSGQGIGESYRSRDNLDALMRTEALLEKPPADRMFVFANLGDFDTKYGHRRNVEGYARALAEVDGFLPRLLSRLGRGDQLWISADHGCDPTYRGTDHTREDVPWLCAAPGWQQGGRLGDARSTLADLGATLLACFGVDGQGLPGRSVEPLVEAARR